MPTVRVGCLVCEHVVEVAASDIALHLDVHGARYGFDCPACHVYVVRRANTAVVDALLRTDARVVTGELAPWERPVRPGTMLVDTGGPRPAGQRHLPPLTEADVPRLRRALADDDALAAWLAG